jgi:glycerol kinase
MRHVIAIDQGTTGSTVLILDETLRVVGRGYREFAQHYPEPGWVEHDPEQIWASVEAALSLALGQAKVAPDAIAAIGITNQRETTIVWDRATGRPVHRAIVWQDRRTADTCAALKAAGHEDAVRARTGLTLDPYFSGTKLAWILRSDPALAAAAARGELAFGTVDSYLLWRLTGGAVHATDVTNASRTLLFDLHTRRWSEELCALFGVEPSLLPTIVPSSGVCGTTRGVAGLRDGVPIAGWPAINSRRCSVRPASIPAPPSAPTAPARSSS